MSKIIIRCKKIQVSGYCSMGNESINCADLLTFFYEDIF